MLHLDSYVWVVADYLISQTKSKTSLSGVILNPEKIATLSNADKLSVVNAWKNHPKDIFGNAEIRNLFADYWDDVPNITSNAQFESLLNTKTDWFDDIFKTNLE